MKSMRRATGFLALAGFVLVAGCTDTKGKLNRFLDETADVRTPPPDTSVGGGTIADVNGTFLLALEATIAPGLPLQFLTTVKFTEDAAGGGGTLDLDLQPLALDLGSTTSPRTPVGDPIVAHGVPVAADGSWVADLGTVAVPGAANPLTGSDISANVVLHGVIQSADLMCGTVTGKIFSPIQSDLAGSTFAAARVPPEAAQDPSKLPGEGAMLVACPGGGQPGADAATADAGEADAGPTDAGPTDVGTPDAGGGSDAVTPTDTGTTPAGCPTVDLSGTWEVQFKTNLSDPNTIGITFEASGDAATCFTGTVFSKTDGAALGTVESATLDGDNIVIVIPDFFIPADANPVTHEDATAKVTLTATQSTDSTMCGTILFEPDFLPITANGDFAGVKDGSGYSLKGYTCDDIEQSGPPSAPACLPVDLRGTWEVQFKTNLSDPNTIGMTLEASGDDATCYTGKVFSKTDGSDLGTVQSATLDGDNIVIVIPDFFIPADANPVTHEDATAKVTLTATQSTDSTMCGTILFEPDFLPITANGDFAAVKDDSGYSLSGFTCDDISGP